MDLDVNGTLAKHQTKEFREFIMTTLVKCKIPDSFILIFTNSDNLGKFKTALTHKSISADSYDLYEFLGDSYIYACISKYILKRFPKIREEGILTKLRIRMSERFIQTKITMGLNLEKWLLIDNDKVDSVKRTKVPSDIFEAFVGAIVSVSDAALREGIGMPIAYNFLEGLFDEIDIDPNSIELTDSITRLKEYYEGRRWGKVHYNTRHAYDSELGRNVIFSKVADLLLNPGEKVVFPEASGITQGESKRNAAKAALDTLAAHFKA
jgi:dsRNA-specific ribonuclease